MSTVLFQSDSLRSTHRPRSPANGRWSKLFKHSSKIEAGAGGLPGKRLMSGPTPVVTVVSTEI